MEQNQVIQLVVDLNPVIRKGMKGVILEVLDSDTYIIECVKEDGSNYEFEGEFTFEVKKGDIRPIEKVLIMKRVNFVFLLVTTIILVVLTLVAFFSGMAGASDDSFIMFLFNILRFPTHTLFWDYIQGTPTSIFFLGLLVNDILYAFLIERIYTYFIGDNRISALK